VGVARAGSSPALGTNHPRWLPLLSAPAQGALAAAPVVLRTSGAQTPIPRQQAPDRHHPPTTRPTSLSCSRCKRPLTSCCPRVVTWTRSGNGVVGWNRLRGVFRPPRLEVPLDGVDPERSRRTQDRRSPKSDTTLQSTEAPSLRSTRTNPNDHMPQIPNRFSGVGHTGGRTTRETNSLCWHGRCLEGWDIRAWCLLQVSRFGFRILP
jgi:hypothetical protein